MTRKKRLSRRHLLRGAGTIAIGLPFLEGLRQPSYAAPGDGVPERFVTVFFGLGLDPSWQRDLSGPLAPYAPYAGKMAMFSTRNGQGNAGGAHCNTSTVVFVGEQQSSVNVAGGPSMDQLIRRELDPAAPVLASGLWWRRGACDAQALRVFNADGSSRSPVKRPSDVFDQVFGSYMPPPPPPPPGGGDPDPAVEAMRRELRIRRSILDTVMDQYRHFRSDASPLSSRSKLKLEQHLNSIREIEVQLAPADDFIDMGDGPGDPGDPGDPPAECDVPATPSDPPIADYDRFTYGTGSGAPEIAWEDYQQVFRLHADLYAMAMRCDLVRYGNLMWESAGGHTNFQGTYRALGDSTNFPGNSQHDSYFHGDQPQHARLVQHLAQANIAYFLGLLDDDEFREENGETVLDNSTILIGTEYGWNHSKQDVFHAVCGGRGRFRSGIFTDRTMNCIDLYNAIATGYGIDAHIGSRTGVESEGDASILLA
ncbi:MAG: DUF1552 domain-containing protein [Myxococcota bacterium]